MQTTYCSLPHASSAVLSCAPHIGFKTAVAVHTALHIRRVQAASFEPALGYVLAVLLSVDTEQRSSAFYQWLFV